MYSETQFPQNTPNRLWHLLPLPVTRRNRTTESDLVFEAIETGNINPLKYFMKQNKVDVNTKDDLGISFLRLAAQKGDSKIVKYLVEHGADVNSENIFGDTPLHYAVSHIDSGIAKYLMDHGANANVTNEFGDTPIHYAKNGKS